MLTYCIDSPDALLYAALLGAGSACALLEALEAPPARAVNETTATSATGAMSARQTAPARAQGNLDGMFISGSARWGHRASQRDVGKFHRAVAQWRTRLADLAGLGVHELERRFSGGGAYWIIGPDHPCWPAQLGDLALRSDWAPPLCLWGRGDPAALVSCPRPIAIVGSRSCNAYGRFVARHVGLKAAESGHLVVSGGAMGADANAHWGALAATRPYGPRPGRTVAVFAGGLGHMGPRSNQRLFRAIENQGGALISELCPDTIPEARRFLLRNRIIAALAHSVVVAQARHRSGALNTASWAAELGREVYAAPGSIDNPENTGCNRLIHEGKAMILISATDLSDVCHAAHDPCLPESPGKRDRQSTPAPAPPAPANQRDRTQGKERWEEPQAALEMAGSRSRTGKQTGDGSGAQASIPEEPTQPTDDQARLVKAIRACQARGIEASCENIAALLAHRQGSDGPPSIQTVMQTAGSMELLGLITIVGGVLAPVSRRKTKG
ncbi:hypothetical protein AB656_01315 [Bifidobacterium actinocoloniiforme DSM 22766]|nr:hypothetical protein AB656_01315 [Bifidobacterium actinocoloniiforme DSM 22766]